MPARASGNREQRRAAVNQPGDDGTATLGLGTPKDGGLWGWFFCKECNGATGVWDQEYLGWQRPILLHLHDHPNRIFPEVLVVEFGDADPGAFVRCIWAWAFALDPSLLDRHPVIAAAVRYGHPVDPPADVRLVIAATRSLKIWFSSQPNALAFTHSLFGDGWHPRRSRLWAPDPEVTDALPVVVSAPPFVVALAGRAHPTEFPRFDPGEWLREPARHRRATAIHLPMVEIADGAWPRILTHADISPARRGRTGLTIR